MCRNPVPPRLSLSLFLIYTSQAMLCQFHGTFVEYLCKQICLPLPFLAPRAGHVEQPQHADQRRNKWRTLLTVYGIGIALHSPSTLQPRPKPHQVGRTYQFSHDFPHMFNLTLTSKDFQPFSAQGTLTNLSRHTADN